MKNRAPYLRQRSDSYWEIVFPDPETGSTRRQSTRTKDKFEAEEVLAEFEPVSADAENADAPYMRRRKDGYWETVYKDDEGKTRRSSTSEKNKKAALAAHELFCKELTKPEIPLRPRVDWIVDKYFDYIVREKPASTSSPMASNVGPLKERLGHLYWDEIVQDIVDDYIEWRMKKPRWASHQEFVGEFGTTSRNTACKDLRVLRAALNRARKNRYTTYPPDFTIVEGDPVRDTTTWITMEEMERMIAACEPKPVVVNGIQTDRVRDREHIEGFLLIALATAARKDAILSLTWDQIYIPAASLTGTTEVPPSPVLDPNDNLVIPKRMLRRTFENPPLDFEKGTVVKGAYIDFGAGSGNKRRPRIPIGQNWRLMNYLITGDRSQPYVITYKGKPVKSLKKGLAEVAKDAKVEKSVTHHTMKRTAITHMVRAGIPFNIIAEAVNTTEEVLKKHYNMHRPDVEEAFGDALSIN